MAGSTLLAALAASVWLWLLLFHGRFWRIEEREDREPRPEPTTWPSIVAIVPARNEADVVEASLASLLDQDYPGSFDVVLVDDDSADGTGAAARALAGRRGAAERVHILSGAPLPSGWTGKLWAVSQGVERARAHAPDYLLLTDADIAYGRGAVRRLAARAVADRLVMTSVMVKLRCESAAEKLLIPAFVFFFRMLYPFRRVNDPRAATAAAAGGCMLIRADALDAAGGVASIRAALIDDCALGARLKRQGAVWLGLSDDIVSLRPYPKLVDIGAMVSRSAYAQLRYSPLLLIGCLIGMTIVYLAPPLLALFGRGDARVLGVAAWAAMTLAFAPIARFYGRSALQGLALPVVAAIYLFYTIRSAVEHISGRGGMWKGRAQAIPEA
jgi:hopene-associated glycosyltransferase HpnB